LEKLEQLFGDTGSIETLKTSSPVIDPATRTESIKNAKLNIATMRTILII
jgi:hypothetical protein